MAGDLYDINVIYNPSTPETILVSVADVSGGVPIGGSTNQSLFKNSNTNGDASWKNIRGFTFVQDTVPTPTRIGETFFDISTGVTSGNAYVVVDNGSGGLIWVQFAPGTASPSFSPAVAFAYAGSNPGGTLAPLNFQTSPLNSDPSQISVATTPGSFTILRDGVYTYSTSVSFAGGVSSVAYVQCLLAVGGSNLAEGIQSMAAGYCTLSCHITKFMTAGTVLAQSFASTAGATTIRYGGFTVERIA